MTEIINDRVFLPDLLREVKDGWGLDTALEFAEVFGGKVIYVPQQAAPDHPVAKAMGCDFLAWLIDRRRGGVPLVVPLGPQSSYRKRIQLIRRLLQEGQPINEIVRLTRCHERTVRRHKEALKGEGVLSSHQGELLL